MAINKHVGVYNCGSLGGMTKADFSLFFLNELFPDYKNYQVISSTIIQNRVIRPKHMVMNSQKLVKLIGHQLETTKNEIIKSFGEYK